MYALLSKLFQFLLPIVKTAVIQTAADVINDVAYPKRKPAFGSPNYFRQHSGLRPYGSRPTASREQAKAAHPSNGDDRVPFLQETLPFDKFHDVLMVAFDITGPNAAIVSEFIENYMPVIGRQTFKGHEVNLDSFWIADDNQGMSDCDSAVFVSKGNQAAARELLREHGLVG